jgi:uncharacterized protein (TIGR01244 family)
VAPSVFQYRCEEKSGRDFVLTRLVEVLLVEALRSTTGDDATPGLLRGLADARLAVAIRRMHGDPARSWTVEQREESRAFALDLLRALHARRGRAADGTPSGLAHDCRQPGSLGGTMLAGSTFMMEPIPVTDDLSFTAQPKPADIAGFAEHGYRTIINNRPDGEEPGQLSAAEARAQAEAVHLEYVYLPVKVGQIGADDVDAFHRALEQSPRPVVAHCKTGTRSYFLWAAGEVLAGRRDPWELISQAAANGYDLRPLPDLVARLRMRRAEPQRG